MKNSADHGEAAPQPAQKHFTDEELKQQYGIHLATRLQADSDGKEAKWADIDDDEDDWAPDAIEWNDGTKITLAQNEAASAAVENSKVVPAAATEQVPDEKEVKPVAAPKPTTTVGPNATVLKPRSSVQPKLGGGVVLKNPAEKPSLVSKPAAPSTVRSPWAILPPIDKVSPVAIKPDVEPSEVRTHSNDPQFANAVASPPPVPAMEIAADSFSRSRGDGVNDNVGQLFNAQSGRYEPASTGRRGSVRKDQNFRPPSVLQRGSTQDQRTSMEVQTSQGRPRTQGEAGVWTRRDSSNVSANGGASARRPSTSKGLPNGLHVERQGSQHSQALQSPTAPGFGQIGPPSLGSPTGSSAQPSIQSPASQHAQIADLRSAAASPAQIRDDAAVQKQLMKEKREAAIKRKKEQEEREEAEKKERIRKKLESLGLPTEKQKPSEKGKPVAEPAKKPEEESLKDSTQSGQRIADQDKAHVDEVQVNKQPEEVEDEGPRSPPKPSIPDTSGGPQQFGMIKMHGTTARNTTTVESNRPAGNELMKSPAEKASDKQAELPQEPTAIDRAPSTLINGKRPSASPPKAAEAAKPLVSRDTKPQPWSDIPKDQKMLSSAWGHQMTRDLSNGHGSVWGAPAQSRALGNGTFDRSSQRSQRTQEPFASPSLAPIGPPKSAQVSRDFKDSLVDASVGASLEDFQALPTFPPSNAPAHLNRHDAAKRPTSAEDHPPLAPFEHTAPTRLPGLEAKAPGLEHQKSRVAAWGAFSNTVTHEEALKRQQHAAKLAEEAQYGTRYEPQLPILNETWKQVRVDELTSQRTIVNVSRTQNVPGQGSSIRFGPAFVAQVSPAPPVTAGIGRGSRFFPTAGRGGLNLYAPPMPFTPGYRRGSSPPPPDSELHPAYTREQLQPRVSLPPVGPKPKVRLPPTSTTGFQPTQKIGSQERQLPPTAPPSWQDKINGLFTRKSSPEKTFSVPALSLISDHGFSVTKEQFTSPVTQTTAAVSLPAQAESISVQSSVKVDSKDVVDEEALFTPESGSLPVVVLPASARRISIATGKAWNRKPALLAARDIQSSSRELLIDLPINGAEGPIIFIHLPGRDVKSKPMASFNKQHMPLVSGQPLRRSGNFPGLSKTNRPAGRPRQTSGNFNSNHRNHTYPRGGPHHGLQSQLQSQGTEHGTPWNPTRVH